MQVYLHQLGRNAQSHYRSALVARHAGSDGVQLTCSPELRLGYDAYVFPRLPAPNFLPVIHDLKTWGRTFIWELDDDLWHIPAWNPAAPAFSFASLMAVHWTAQQADRVVVSTPPLREVVIEQTGVDPDKVHVLPNLLDLDEWPELPPREPGPVRILWAGSRHHDGDLEEIVEPLERLIEDYGDDFQVYFLGDWPKRMSEWARIRYSHLSRQVPKSARVGFVDPVPLEDYPRTLAILRPDIALAPLCDEPFNNSKSNLKFLEYSMAGAATVATDLPPYQCIEDGVTGLLVGTGDGDGWYESIAALIEDADARESMASAARERVVREWTWQHSPLREKWVNFFRGLAS